MTDRLPTPESGFAKDLLSQRRQREKLLGPELAKEPAWTMLLALFVAYEEGEQAVVMQLCTETGTPPALALRWLRTLASEGMVAWKTESADPYRALVELEPGAADRLRRLFLTWMNGTNPAGPE